MSGKRIKSIRRQVNKETNKIRLAFLNSIEHEPFSLRFKIAMRIIFKWNPGRKKNIKKENPNPNQISFIDELEKKA